MNADNLPFNWFDIAVALVLLVGMQRGRKRGMSEECLTMLNWVTLVVVCSFAYEPVGQFLASVGGHVKKTQAAGSLVVLPNQLSKTMESVRISGKRKFQIHCIRDR